MSTTNTRNVTITTLNWIPALGMDGPIIFPRRINEEIVYKIVRSGFEVFEHAVTGPYAGKKIRLTVSNFYDEKRFAPEVKEAPTAVNTIKNLGAAVNGQAKVVESTTKNDPVPFTNEATAEETPVVPKVATPINSTMSKSQRKKAAKAAAAAARAAANAAQEATEPEAVLDPSNTEVEEESVETDATETVTEETEEVTE